MATPAAEFLSSFRFGTEIDGKAAALSMVGEIEVFEERHGNRRVKPVTISSAPQVGGIGLAALVNSRKRHTVDIFEFDRNGECARRLRLYQCKFKRYRLEEKDATGGPNAAFVCVEHATLHPQRIRVFKGER
ncbi:MAG: hypothetical protein ABFD77_03865 [Thermotogota bacterium]